MYVLQVDGYVYPRPLTLPQALIEIRGCAGAKILRAADLSIVVERAGSDTEVEYVSHLSGRRRTVRRRPTRVTLAGMRAASSAPAVFSVGA
jgi:hypothetical protein